MILKKDNSNSNLPLSSLSLVQKQPKPLEDIQHKNLIEKCLHGDMRAQHKLFHLYVKAMYNTVLRIVPATDEAEDIVQEGFIKAFTKLDQYKHSATFGAWLKRIMVNTALNSIKKYSPEFTPLEVLAENSDEADVDRIKGMPTPTEINHEVQKLPEGCRIIFTLHLIEGYEQKEVAKMLSVSTSTVKTQYRRARILLRERLNAKGYE